MVTTSTPYVSGTTSYTDPTTGTTRTAKKELGQEDFLRLLTVQLSKQDPMKPMDDNSFIAQMAQFSSLQQTSQMVKEFAQLRFSSDLSSASMLLGRTVTVMDGDQDVTGMVTGIDASDGTPQLVIDSKLYPLSEIRRVEPDVLPAA